jgi:hypothetical protein
VAIGRGPQVYRKEKQREINREAPEKGASSTQNINWAVQIPIKIELILFCLDNVEWLDRRATRNKWKGRITCVVHNEGKGY